VDLDRLLERLAEDPGYIALLSGRELELLAEMDPDDLESPSASPGARPSAKSKKGALPLDATAIRYSRSFLKTIQKAADRHLQEKNEIRDALGLLKIYHRASSAPAAGATACRALDETDAKIESKKSKSGNKKTDAKTDAKTVQHEEPQTSSGCRTRLSLNVVKSKQSSVEASPNKRRKN
jgi:hypothetical protein